MHKPKSTMLSLLQQQYYSFLVISPFVVITFVNDYTYINTRQTDSMNRRISVSNHTSLSKKNIYIKESIQTVLNSNTSPNLGNVGLEMNRHESQYKLPYSWGGDIKDFSQGLDCTGFVHGMMYYLGHNTYMKRFNT